MDGPGGEEIIMSNPKVTVYCSRCNIEITGDKCEKCGLKIKKE